MKTITAVTPDALEAERIYSESDVRLSIIMPCEKCNMWRLVDRENDKVGETIGEVRGMNYHDGLAHYICQCGEPFDLYIDL